VFNSLRRHHSQQQQTGMHRIVVVGPVEPFRSGVARHTSALAKALAARPDTQVDVLSFSRQYPALLFPGEDDRAPDGARLAEPKTRYGIDSLNPLTWFAAARPIAANAPDLVVMPAWTFFLAPCLGTVARRARRSGAAIVMVVHNVSDHEAAFYKSWLSAWQLRAATGFITHNEGLAAALRGVVPDARIAVRPHPLFHYPAPRNTLPRRAELELLMFGIVRPYKGLEVLLHAIAQAQRTSIRLSVVGEFWENLDATKALIARLGIGDRVELVPRFVSDAEAAEYFARADAVVLPYRAVTGSGVVPLAYRYGKPVVVSRLPGFLELVVDGQTGWTVPVDDPGALAAAIDTRVTAAAAAAMRPAIEKAGEDFTWGRFADAVVKIGGLAR
jgi:D-inositol-3-phosphate glycosyltransferase